MPEIVCFKCQNRWSYEVPLGRRDDCPKCGWDAHVCHNCVHFDIHASKQCKEPQVELVQDKERANFCDYFVGNTSKAASSGDGAKAQLEALFGSGGGGDSAPPKSKIEEELDAFFKKKD